MYKYMQVYTDGPTTLITYLLRERCESESRRHAQAAHAERHLCTDLWFLKIYCYCCVWRIAVGALAIRLIHLFVSFAGQGIGKYIVLQQIARSGP